jgi:Ulp1 family protease
VDQWLITDLSDTSIFASESDVTQPRILRRDGLPTVQFRPQDLEILNNPTALLNDVCINGGAALLQHLFSAKTLPLAMHSQRCALFSTFDLVQIRSEASDDDLWHNVRLSRYWEKDVWILPIHRPHTRHWVLCCISLKTHELFLFDSLVAERPWWKDISDIVHLIEQLVQLASGHGYRLNLVLKPWIAHPLVCLWFSSTLVAHLPAAHSLSNQ